MTLFDFLKIIALDKEVEALASASAPAEKTTDELSEEEMDLIHAAAGQKPFPTDKKPTQYG